MMKNGPSPNDTPPTPGILLAGGLARRMGGGDKPMRPLAGRTEIAHPLCRPARRDEVAVPVVVEHRLPRQTGEGWARTSLQRLDSVSGGALVAVVEDMTSDHEALEQQRREAEIDPLTGLLNRRGGDRRTHVDAQGWGRVGQHGQCISVSHY